MKSFKLGLALLAALALVFAGACNNDPVYEDSGTSGDSTSGGSTTPTDAGGHVLVDDPSAEQVGYTTSNDGKTYHVYTLDGLNAWADAAKTDPSISCTLYNCIEWEASDGRAEWTPVGTSSSNSYAGSFDGGRHTVYGLDLGTVTDSSNNYTYAGFFGYLGSGGAVEGLGVEIKNCAGAMYTAGIAGYSYGSITACYSTGAITATGGTSANSYYVGGIVGINYGTITACYSTADVAATGGRFSYAGGIAGSTGTTGTTHSITACYSTGTITATGGTSGNYAGGIAGANYGDTNYGITACYWSGEYSSAGYSDGAVTNSSKIGDSGTTWETAQTAMNSAIQEYDSSITWSYSGAAANTPPTLKKSG